MKNALELARLHEEYKKDNWSGGTSSRDSGMPDFLHMWDRSKFQQVGYGLITTTLASYPLFYLHDVTAVLPFLLTIGTGAYWKVGLADMKSKQALRKNFPVLIYFRYILENIRPEIRQYLIEGEQEAEPFSRSMRNVVYRRAKGADPTACLGTRVNVYEEGYEWINHSMFPVPHDEVEDRVTIGGPHCKRPYSASLLNISAMSYGALSGNAIHALSKGASLGQFYHNTGEGGISTFHLKGGANLCWNIGTGYFACGKNSGPNGARKFDPEQFQTTASLEAVKMIEIKLSQGAKPAHGGILPAAKITPLIAEARGLGSPPYQDCNSPPRHSAFSTPEELMLFVGKLREMSDGKPVGFKFCVGDPAEFAALCHAMIDTGITPDFITVDGSEGGTGAAPPEFQDAVGMPLQEGLVLVDGMLIGANLRDKITIIASGKVYNGFSLVRTLALGADICNAARSMMFALGCIQALRCNSNDCPTGITTQKPELSSSLDVDHKSLRVYNFQKATVHAAKELLGAAGLRSGQDVTPSHIFYRVEGRSVRLMEDGKSTSYFHRPKAGSLLTDEGISAQRSPQLGRWWVEGGKKYNSTKRGDGYLAL